MLCANLFYLYNSRLKSTSKASDGCYITTLPRCVLGQGKCLITYSSIPVKYCLLREMYSRLLCNSGHKDLHLGLVLENVLTKSSLSSSEKERKARP
jgi:hypothetical protein